MSEPKYHHGQVLRITHTWASAIPPRPVENSHWDEKWACYTYSFPLAMIRIEEHMLEATEEPDIEPEEWFNNFRASKVKEESP